MWVVSPSKRQNFSTADRKMAKLNIIGTDVYAAGLTFAAMLQAQPGRHLLPKTEGFLQSGETRMSVGLAAHNRMMSGQSEITVVEDKTSDCVLAKYIKNIIRAMTCVSPTHRLSASKVYGKV